MADEESRRQIIDRANRLVKQSKTLRKLSDELLAESNDIRTHANRMAKKTTGRKQKRQR